MGYTSFNAWTATEQNTLATLWPDHSAAEIGKVLKKSRNAIIGQARRMKLMPKGFVKQKDGSRRLYAPRKGKPRKPVIVTAPAVRVFIREIPALPSPEKGIPLLEATHNQCKAIIGSTDDGRALAVVCGEAVKSHQGFEFCAYHLERYTVRSHR